VSQPLTGIMARASAGLRWLAAEPPNLEKVRELLNHIVTASEHMSDVISSVRSMFKKDTTKKTSQIDVNKLILTVLATARTDLQRANIETRTELDERAPVVQGDMVQLQQVILNLVMNAMEAMHSVQYRVLTARCRLSKADVVYVAIEDTGPGVESDDRDRIFERLFTTKAHGMGMGLSICRSIVENHAGRIWVSPAAHGGSIFQFELPAS
jgi:signal transduction histidine kinase